MTLDEKLILFDDEALMVKSDVHKPIDKLNIDEIINMSANGCANNDIYPRDILTLENLIEIINATRIKAFIMSRRTDGKFLDNLHKFIEHKKDLNASNIILCSHSIFMILKVSTLSHIRNDNLFIFITFITVTDKVPRHELRLMVGSD